jgi:hypothetical protein
MSNATATKVTLTFSKETKNTFVFVDQEDGAVIPSLYVRKEAFPNGAPDSITVTVS